MPHKHGTHLGGIHTLEDLRQRCEVEEESGCWLWHGASRRGQAYVHFVRPDTGARAAGQGRRVALLLAGKPAGPKQIAYARACCPNENCCNPDHAQAGSKAAWGKALAASGKVKGLPTKFAGARKVWDKRGRRITPAMVQEIRHSDLSDTHVAAKVGISRYAVWAVRRGLIHRGNAPAASVFTWKPIPPAPKASSQRKAA